ncbi:MAG: hypothetical protein MJZ18_10760 [Bacteroidales bacterium]|nr:hypothetical protein [Bacteroidales bacterium]
MNYIQHILHNVRTTRVNDLQAYCLRDVCSYLTINYTSSLISRLKGCVTNAPLETSGGVQDAKYVTLEGVLKLAMSCSTIEAESIRLKLSQMLTHKLTTRRLATANSIVARSYQEISIDNIYNVDCLIGMRSIADRSIDCIICDLPFGTTEFEWDCPIPLSQLWEQYNRILKPQGSVLLFGTEPFSSKLRMSNITNYKYDWVWVKNRPSGFQHARNMPLRSHELISVFSNANMGHVAQLGDSRMTYNPQNLQPAQRSYLKSYNYLGAKRKQNAIVNSEYENYPRSILYYDCDESHLHPTQKPVELLEYLIRTYTNEGDLVLDNCMGSGTTAVACINTGRRFIGFEINKEFYETAKKRIEEIKTLKYK